MRTICEDASRFLHPTFSKHHPDRHPAAQSFGVIYFVARKDDHVHLHGFIRIPKHEGDLVSLYIREDAVSRRLRVSEPERYFVNALRSETRSRNVWIGNDGTHLLPDIQNRFSHLKYLETPKAEDREWEELELVPKLVFQRLTTTNAA